MPAYTPNIQESVQRAKDLKLENIIRSLAKQEDERHATPKQISQRRNTLLRQIEDPGAAETRLERILQGNELSDISYLSEGLLCARAVCRVVIRRGGALRGYGTGFLVAPGVLLTNHHVFPGVDDVRESIAQFEFERDIHGADVTPVEFKLRVTPAPICFKDLDLALVAVETRSADGHPLDQYGWLRLSPQSGKAFVGEYLTIIQHPNGERKQICVRENKLLKYSENGPYIWYQTDTVAGASGSPVFNNSWDVVALHHSSVPRTKQVRGRDVWLARNGKPWTSDMGDDQIDWMANEGVRVSRIVQFLQSQYPNDPLAQAVITAEEPRTHELLAGSLDGMGGYRVRSDGNGNTRILVPVEIGIKVGITESKPASTAEPAPDLTSSPRVQPTRIEAVIIDQGNYNKRNGFNPKFLGAALMVKLPEVTAPAQTKFGKPLVVSGSTQIKYWNYSVVMNPSRKLAYFSAANVDSSKFRGARDAAGDTWYRDTRVDKIDKAFQLGREFYKKQSEFEADRTTNPFDQGHLTARNHLQWGADDDEAKRNGDDSYHYTNCAPQHWQFNQNNKASGLWFRLEESAISTLSRGSRLCLINGPIFDSPLCIAGSDGMLRLNLGGKRVKDGTFGDIKIPKLFFKVIAYAKDNKLRAKAFVVTQEDLLATIDRYYPAEKAAVLSDQEVRLYQVKIADLEKVTGLKFGSLSQCDVPAGEESVSLAQGTPIEDEADLEF